VEAYLERTKEIENFNITQEHTPPADIFLEGLEMFEKTGSGAPFFIKFVRVMQGNKNLHKWMYDFYSLSRRLEKIGFTDIQKKEFQESLIEDVHLLDNRDRFDRCVCVEAIKR
jgi:hypothetical protein